MHLGIFTPTEASAVAVFYALLVGRFLYRTLQFSMLPAILYRTAILTASILMIIAASRYFPSCSPSARFRRRSPPGSRISG